MNQSFLGFEAGSVPFSVAEVGSFWGQPRSGTSTILQLPSNWWLEMLFTL